MKIFEDGAPSATITIASWLVLGAAKYCLRLLASLQHRIDIEQVVALANDANANGIILDIEDHEDKDRVSFPSCGRAPVRG